MQLLRARPLVAALASGELTAEERAYYLLASGLAFNLFYYSGFVTSGTTPWTYPYMAEFLIILLINVVGVVKTFDAAGGKSNNQYLIDFTCLSVPVFITTWVPIWGIYWLLRFGFYESVMSLSQSDLQFAMNMVQLGFDGFSLLAFVATIASSALFYARLVKLLFAVRVARSEA